MTRQFIAVRFRPGDRRTYTYANDGDPVRPGDRVKVPDRSGDGWQSVEVVEEVSEPSFACKTILGLVDGAAIDEKLLAVPAPAPAPPGDLFRDYVEDTRSGLNGPGMFPDVFGDD